MNRRSKKRSPDEVFAAAACAGSILASEGYCSNTDHSKKKAYLPRPVRFTFMKAIAGLRPKSWPAIPMNFANCRYCFVLTHKGMGRWIPNLSKTATRKRSSTRSLTIRKSHIYIYATGNRVVTTPELSAEDAQPNIRPGIENPFDRFGDG